MKKISITTIIIGIIIGCSGNESLFTSSSSGGGHSEESSSNGNLSCLKGTKECNNQCVPLDNPSYGCASNDCLPCSLANSATICANGICAIDHCIDGFKNCDLDQSNGCESQSANDINNCGDCGIVCSVAPNSNSVCMNGKCQIICNKYYGDCDLNYSNGCEIKLTDNNNCGSCNKVCGNISDCSGDKCTCFFGTLNIFAPAQPNTKLDECENCAEDYCCNEIKACNTDGNCQQEISNWSVCSINNQNNVINCPLSGGPNPSNITLNLKTCLKNHQCNCGY